MAENSILDFDEKAFVTSLGRAETAVAGLERQMKNKQRQSG